jgi:3-hydroxyisobutyrate dehydrogenase-like beta-hydroxyacid dehydrogenase
MRVGCIGLGPMGVAMARRLLLAGHDLTVWNRTAEKGDDLVGEGARRAPSPEDAAAHAEVVVTSVADDAALESVTLGQHGLADALSRGCVHVSTSTVSPALVQRLAVAHAERGQGFVSAPVLGRPPAAANGKLFVMAAGPPDAVEQARPVLEAIGQRLFVVGERAAQANLVKLACNFLIFSTIEQLGEVFALAEKGGVDRARVFEVLTESFFGAPVHRNYGQLILERAYNPPGARVTLGMKDTRLLLDAAEALSVPLPLASLLRDRFIAAVARGEKDYDFTVIAQQAAEAAGLLP